MPHTCKLLINDLILSFRTPIRPRRRLLRPDTSHCAVSVACIASENLSHSLFCFSTFLPEPQAHRNHSRSCPCNIFILSNKSRDTIIRGEFRLDYVTWLRWKYVPLHFLTFASGLSLMRVLITLYDNI